MNDKEFLSTWTPEKVSETEDLELFSLPIQFGLTPGRVMLLLQHMMNRGHLVIAAGNNQVICHKIKRLNHDG